MFRPKSDPVSRLHWTPPGPYMLFLIDANGVPSVGSIMSVGP